MKVLLDLLKWLFTIRKEKAREKRATTVDLATEIDGLADLLENVLKATSPDGSLNLELLPGIHSAHRKVWTRWVTILGTSGYATQDTELQQEIEHCIKIAHAAPGAYVEEVLLVQMCLASKNVSIESRNRFESSIDNLRNLSVKMRLNR